MGVFMTQDEHDISMATKHNRHERERKRKNLLEHNYFTLLVLVIQHANQSSCNIGSDQTNFKSDAIRCHIFKWLSVILRPLFLWHKKDIHERNNIFIRCFKAEMAVVISLIMTLTQHDVSSVSHLKHRIWTCDLSHPKSLITVSKPHLWQCLASVSVPM